MHGMGGIGKTVLASMVANSDAIRDRFPDGVFWLTVSQDPDFVVRLTELAKWQGLKADFDTINEATGILKEHLKDQQVLLVLDDVWETKHIRPLDVAGPKGRTLITTRIKKVLDEFGARPHAIGQRLCSYRRNVGNL